MEFPASRQGLPPSSAGTATMVLPREDWIPRGLRSSSFWVPQNIFLYTARTGDTALVKSKEMTGRTQTLPWWLEREGVKTTENKIHWPRCLPTCIVPPFSLFHLSGRKLDVNGADPGPIWGLCLAYIPSRPVCLRTLRKKTRETMISLLFSFHSLTLFYTRGVRDSCFTCDGSSTIQVFPLFFNLGYGTVTILEFSSKWEKVILPYIGGQGCL